MNQGDEVDSINTTGTNKMVCIKTIILQVQISIGGVWDS